eukprot:Gb_36354 [translate_table: standard]
MEMYLPNIGNPSAMLVPCEEDYDSSYMVKYNPNSGEARAGSSSLYSPNSFHSVRSQSQCTLLEENNYEEACVWTPHVDANFECGNSIYSAHEETGLKNLKTNVGPNFGEGTECAGISQLNVHQNIQKIPCILEYDEAWDLDLVYEINNETPTSFQLQDSTQTNTESTGRYEIKTKETKQQDQPSKTLKKGKPPRASRYNGALGRMKGKLNSWNLKKAYGNGISCLSESKDRHSKVVTSRGPRDRRMRLSIETAMKVFSLQDRLGFDQPSQAIEWLIQKSNYAISELPQILRTPPTPDTNIVPLSPVQCWQPSPYSANGEYQLNFDEEIVEGSFSTDLSTEPSAVLPYSPGKITPYESNEDANFFTGSPIEDDLWLVRQGNNSTQLNGTALRSSPRKGSRVMASAAQGKDRGRQLGELPYERGKMPTATCYSQWKTSPNSPESNSNKENENIIDVCEPIVLPMSGVTTAWNKSLVAARDQTHDLDMLSGGNLASHSTLSMRPTIYSTQQCAIGSTSPQRPKSQLDGAFVNCQNSEVFEAGRRRTRKLLLPAVKDPRTQSLVDIRKDVIRS